MCFKETLFKEGTATKSTNQSEAAQIFFFYNWVKFRDAVDFLVIISYFLVSSICSTSLDSSTTLPSTMVWVTTFTIFLVRTSGSSAQTRNRQMLTLLYGESVPVFC